MDFGRLVRFVFFVAGTSADGGTARQSGGCQLTILGGPPATGVTPKPVCSSQRQHAGHVNLGSVAYSVGTKVLQPGQRDGSECSGGIDSRADVFPLDSQTAARADSSTAVEFATPIKEL